MPLRTMLDFLNPYTRIVLKSAVSATVLVQLKRMKTMKFSDIKTFKDLLASFFVLKFDPEDEPKPKRARKKKWSIQSR